MNNWLDKLRCLLGSESVVILVTVIAVRGSAPREVGAKLLIFNGGQWGTVGGGNLEYQAIAIAQDIMRASASVKASNTSLSVAEPFASATSTLGPVGSAPRIHSFALGPTLGQCCGGHVDLMFECIDRCTEWLDRAASLIGSETEKRYWLCRSLCEPYSHQFIEDGDSAADQYLTTHQPSGSQAKMVYGDSLTPRATDDVNTSRRANPIANGLSGGWWCELLDSTLPEVWVFGAGHVGSALHEQLKLLPCTSVAVDSRDELLQKLSPGARVVLTDCYAAEVASVPAGAWIVVMTHSHTEDFGICHAVLKRTDFAYLGLIGSSSKRAMFARRLAHRGIEQSQIDRLISPIGLTTIRSRHPQLIALGVATDLTLRWQDASL